MTIQYLYRYILICLAPFAQSRLCAASLLTAHFVQDDRPVAVVYRSLCTVQSNRLEMPLSSWRYRRGDILQNVCIAESAVNYLKSSVEPWGKQ